MNLLARLPRLRELSRCESIFIDEIAAPREGVLRLTLKEGGGVWAPEPRDVTEDFLARFPPSKPIARRVFELKWERCVAYCATDETYAPNDRVGDEPNEALRWVSSFERSSFLEYVSKTTYATDHHLLTLQHIRVSSYNWIVDVASDELPTMIELEPEYR